MAGTKTNEVKFEIAEMFYSLQGEGTRAGMPCVFIRLQGCNLNCEWCDTEYARKFGEGKEISFADIIDFADESRCEFIEFTGGEPLLQPNIHKAIKYFCDAGKTVAVETNGSFDISQADSRAVRIVDVKCPDSNMAGQTKPENLEQLTTRDEVKFVLMSRKDYIYAKKIIDEYDLVHRTNAVLLSAVYGSLPHSKLAEWILHDHLQVRQQLQLHKIIFGADKRGV
jgi:7-carboxy-7-deazaguanine synthase